jgi:hypothetical protein
MALLFDTPSPVNQGKQRFYVCRLTSNLPGAAGSRELLQFCRRLGVPGRAIDGAVAHIAGGQISTARTAGALEVSPQQLDTIIRSTSNG